MAQGAEEAGGGLHKGQGPDAGHGVPNPGSQLIGAVGAALGGSGGYLQASLVPEDGQLQLLPVGVLKDGLNLLNGADLFVVDVGDNVTLLQSAGLGRRGQPLVGGDV